MAHYTITIQKLMKNNFNFGLNNYPIFDETYRQTLNNNILNHFYMNEIGLETPELFKFYLNQTMNEIMPKYNALYKAQQELLNNILGNVNLTEQLVRNIDNRSNSSSNSTNENKNVYQDTPQGSLVNQDINNFTYATNMSLSSNNGNDITSLNGNTTEDYIKTIIGNNGNKYNAEIYKIVVDNFNSIDLSICNELTDLFMGLLL